MERASGKPTIKREDKSRARWKTHFRLTCLVILLVLPGVLGLRYFARQPNYRDDPFLYYMATSRILGRTLYLVEYQWDPKTLGPFPNPGGFISVTYNRPQLPYTEVQFEYPPLSLLIFVPPRMLSDRFEAYFQYFAWFMSLCAIGTGILFFFMLRILQPGLRQPALWAAAFFSIFIWCAGRTLVFRFDIAVTLVVAAAFVAALRQRNSLAALLLGLAIGLKLWPIFILPLFLMPDVAQKRWKELAQNVGAAMLFPIVSHALILPFTGFKVFNYVRYHGARGFEIESVWATLMVIWARATRTGIAVKQEFGAFHVHPPYSIQPLVLASYATMLATSAWTLGSAWKSVRRMPASGNAFNPTLCAAAIASTIALMLSAKILSAQFVFWLFPMAMALPGKRGRAVLILYILVLCATQFVFPIEGWDLFKLGYTSTIGLVFRDLLLAAMLMLCVGITQTPLPANISAAPSQAPVKRF